jgi:hypothetical protein
LVSVSDFVVLAIQEGLTQCDEGLMAGEGVHLLTVMLINKIFDGFYRGVYRFIAK